MIASIIGYIIGLAFAYALPLIAFLTTPNAFSSLGAVFTGEGWNTAVAYFTQGNEWDKWLFLIVGIIAILLWFTAFVLSFFHGHPFKAVFSSVNLVIFFLVIYIFAAWPDRSELELWRRIFVYVHVIGGCIGLFFTASRLRKRR